MIDRSGCVGLGQGLPEACSQLACDTDMAQAVGAIGRYLQLEDDIEGRDRYGRRLAYVVVDGERFNDELLRRGYARLLVIEPNHAHARTMLREELDAKRAGRGLWSEC